MTERGGTNGAAHREAGCIRPTRAVVLHRSQAPRLKAGQSGIVQITHFGAALGDQDGPTPHARNTSASFDTDGYLWFSGRADEIIKIAGHRLGTIVVETAFLRHPAVAEAG